MPLELNKKMMDAMNAGNLQMAEKVGFSDLNIALTCRKRENELPRIN